MATVTCSDCQKEIECCAACDEEDCGAPICFECLVVEIGEAAGPTHERGRAEAAGRIDPERR